MRLSKEVMPEEILSSILKGLHRYECETRKVNGVKAEHTLNASKESIETEPSSGASNDDSMLGMSSSPGEVHLKRNPHVDQALHRERLLTSFRLSTTSYYLRGRNHPCEGYAEALREEIFLKDAFPATSPVETKLTFDGYSFTATNATLESSDDLLSELTRDRRTYSATWWAYGEDASLCTWSDENMAGSKSDKHVFRRIGLLRRDSCASSITFSDASTATAGTRSYETPDDLSISVHSFGAGVSGVRDYINSNSNSRSETLQANLKNWWDDECAIFSLGHCASQEGTRVPAASKSLSASTAEYSLSTRRL